MLLNVFHCAVPGCAEEVCTIWRGYALCEDCYMAALGISNAATPEQMIRIVMDAQIEQEEAGEEV